MTAFRRQATHYRPLLVALVAALGALACTDVPPAPGGTGGTAGMGGVGGVGGAGGMGGVGGGTNTPPEATIVEPAADSGINDSEYAYDGFDSDMSLWYKDVALVGTGVDTEDGTLSGEALQWKTNRTDLQDETLGTGANPTVRLYSDVCVGTEHIITLEVTDSDGASTTSEPRTLRIWTLC